MFDTFELGGEYNFRIPVKRPNNRLYYKHVNQKHFYITWSPKPEDKAKYFYAGMGLTIEFMVRTKKGLVHCSFINSVHSVQFERLFKDASFYFTGTYPNIEMIVKSSYSKTGLAKIPIKQWI